MDKETKQILLAIGIVLVDIVAFAIPLGACLLAYVLIMKPKWFKEYVLELYK